MTEAKSVTIKQSNAEQRANNTADFGELLAHYRAYFQSGATRSVEWRESQLIALRSMMKDHAEDFYTALWTDLRRNRIEADWVDVKYVTSEIEPRPCSPAALDEAATGEHASRVGAIARGVGNFGMGKYHGEWGFRASSNARGVLSQSTHIDVGGLRYPPYDRNRILREIVIPS